MATHKISTGFETLDDDQLHHHVRQLARSIPGGLTTSAIWMRRCHLSFLEARRRGKRRYRDITAGVVPSAQAFAGWKVDDWRVYFCEKLGATTSADMRRLDAAAQASMQFHGLAGALALRGPRRDSRIAGRPVAAVVDYIRKRFPTQSLAEIKEAATYLVRAIARHEEWRAICDALGWPHEEMPRQKYCKRYQCSDLLAIAAQYSERHVDARSTYNRVISACRPLKERQAILIAIPQVATAEFVQRLVPYVADAIKVCSLLKVTDEATLRERLPALWEHCQKQAWLRPSFWARLAPATEEVT